MDDRRTQEFEWTWSYWRYALPPLMVVLSIPLIFSACYQWIPGVILSTALILVFLISCSCLYRSQKKTRTREIPMEVEREWPRAPARAHAPRPDVNAPRRDPNVSSLELPRQTNPPPTYAAATRAGNTLVEVGIEPPGWKLASLLPK